MNKRDLALDPIMRKGHAHKMKQRVPTVCPACKGSGFFGKEYCTTCNGEGVVDEY